MNADRVNQIMGEETGKTLLALSSTDVPPDVRADARAMMEAIVEAIDRWARAQNRVIDGRAGLLALSFLANQQERIMRRLMDESAGPRGPHAK